MRLGISNAHDFKKRQSIIKKQKRAVSAASGGPYANRTLLTKLSHWDAGLIFVFKQWVNLICSFKSFSNKFKQTAFSIFIKNIRIVIPKYEHILVPHA